MGDKVLKKFWFIGGNDDPWLYVMKMEMGIVYISLYVNDDLMVGDIEAINNAITAENGFY